MWVLLVQCIGSLDMNEKLHVAWWELRNYRSFKCTSRFFSPLTRILSLAWEALQKTGSRFCCSAPLRRDGGARGCWQQKCFGCFLSPFSIYCDCSQHDRRCAVLDTFKVAPFFKRIIIAAQNSTVFGDRDTVHASE